MEKPIFIRALESFTDEDQKIIQEVISEWSKKAPFGQRISRNFSNELFLPRKCMISLLQTILTNREKGIDEIESEYQEECYKHVLKGEPISPSKKPKIFGVAIEKEIFKRHLQKNYKKYLHNAKERDEFINSLLDSKYITGSKYSFYTNFKVKQYSVWSTWNHKNINKKPFEFNRTKQADEIRANMGLTELETSKDLLLFMFKMPKEIEPQIATIADAGLYPYFEPPVDKLDGHGWTVCRPPRPYYEKYEYNLESRPECIHDSITLDSVLLPIEKRN